MTRVAGILNLTPDSFSDGGNYFKLDKAVRHAHRMLEAGADLIDIGGESTRPGSQIIAPEEEVERVLPVVKALVSDGISQISIDTRNAKTAFACLKAGATWINDVSAFTHDPKMVFAARDAEGVILMHMRGTPQNMQQGPIIYSDVIGEIKTYLAERIEYALNNNLRREQIIIDPGIGFGKTLEHNIEILCRLDELKTLGPVMVGPSRKRFIGELTGVSNAAERDFGTVGAV
ncbi:MAG: dihydropteroate synthase, partial [Deltaproteobacteria bacterium]|nr:dihydropteroate synthase [Deltaproteobacteria bacterium]